MEQKRRKKALLQAFKIAVGSSAAIYLAESFHLEFGTSAGSIALLTIVATKWETVRLSVLRIVTFVIAVILSWLTIAAFHSEWVAYGVFIFVLIMICELLGWKSTISVNAVIGTHFLTTGDFGRDFILNEFWLVLIGISIALLLNLFHNNRSHKKEIIRNMRYTEEKLQMILKEVAAYLAHEKMTRSQSVWEEIKTLEKKLQDFVGDAYEYQDNTFQSHPGYYIDYFEMRTNQFNVLHNLHSEMKKIREMSRQAALVADYVQYMSDFVVERNSPYEQIEKLEEIFEAIRQAPLPSSREEFESRAILYHILMDLEEFLIFKRRFVEGLDEKQRKIYWERDGKDSLLSEK